MYTPRQLGNKLLDSDMGAWVRKINLPQYPQTSWLQLMICLRGYQQSIALSNKNGSKCPIVTSYMLEIGGEASQLLFINEFIGWNEDILLFRFIKLRSLQVQGPTNNKLSFD